MCVPLFALGVTRGARTGRGWWIAGVALGACLAVQEKGLLTVAGLVPAIPLAVATGGGVANVSARVRRALPGLVLPGAILAAAYLAFPMPLSSLDAQLQLQVTGLGAHSGLAVLPGSDLTSRADPPGWIFGRQMGPSTLLGVARLGMRPTDRFVRRDHRMKLGIVLTDAFPASDPRFLALLGALSGAGLVGAIVSALRGRGTHGLVAGVALAGGAASGLPALNSDFNLRFELASAWAVPALLAMGAGAVGALPAALLHRDTRRAAGIAAVATTFVFVGPARGWTTWQWDASPLFLQSEGHELLAGQVWHDLQQRWPHVPIDVLRPFDGGALAIDGREGGYLDGPELDSVPPAADHWVILPARRNAASIGQPAAALRLTTHEGRAVRTGERWIAMTWAIDPVDALYLLTPEGVRADPVAAGAPAIPGGPTGPAIPGGGWGPPAGSGASGPGGAFGPGGAPGPATPGAFVAPGSPGVPTGVSPVPPGPPVPGGPPPPNGSAGPVAPNLPPSDPGAPR
jgi:hypothetical protein